MNTKKFSTREIEIRTAHEIMAARTTQLALLVDQLMPALQAKPPMFAGNVSGRSNASICFSVTFYNDFNFLSSHRF
jgi:hypothetical protein